MEELIPIISVLSVFGTITAVCVLPGYFKLRGQREMQKTVRAAIAEGQQLPLELIDVLTRDVKKGLPTRARDIRRGVFYLAAAIGTALLGQFTNVSINISDNHSISNGLLGLACVPLAFGIAYLVLSYFNKD